jgi:hypothetical protein
MEGQIKNGEYLWQGTEALPMLGHLPDCFTGDGVNLIKVRRKVCSHTSPHRRSTPLPSAACRLLLIKCIMTTVRRVSIRQDSGFREGLA